MALYKRPNSRYWWLDFEFEGRRHQLSTKCRNKRDAEKFTSAYRTQLANNKVDLRPKRPTMNFAEAANDFLSWSELQQKESTFKRYETSSKGLIKFFGPRLVSEIGREHIEKFVAWRSKQKKKAPALKLAKKPDAVTRKAIQPATINRELAFLRIVFNRLLDRDIITKNPAARFSFLPENNDQIRVLTPAEERTYLMACSQPLRDVAVIMLETGMRPSEVYGLRNSDIDFALGFAQVSTGKTRSARRKIPLSDAVRETLFRRVRSAPGDYVFGGGLDGKSDKPIVKLTNAHRAAVERAKLPSFRLYDLRHTFATRACEAGIDLVTVKDLLGHARLEMVLRYSHPTEAHRAEAIRKMDNRRNRLHVGENVGATGTD